MYWVLDEEAANPRAGLDTLSLMRPGNASRNGMKNTCMEINGFDLVGWAG
jgi:hypothetical protein